MPHLKLFKEAIEKAGGEVIERLPFVEVRYTMPTAIGKNFCLGHIMSVAEIEQCVCPELLGTHTINYMIAKSPVDNKVK